MRYSTDCKGGSMQSSTFTFKSEDDLEIFVYRWLPDDPALRGVVQISHGMGEHAGRYERLARHLTGAGFAVYANDQRGHGRTVPEPFETSTRSIARWLRITRMSRSSCSDTAWVRFWRSST